MQQAIQSEKHECLVQHALMKIGYNLLEFQRIEAFLKLISPYLVTPTDKRDDRPFMSLNELLANKQTLGMLVQRLKDANQSGDKAALEKYVNDVLNRRNDLIHHFVARQDAQLDTEEKCRSAISYLDEQRRFIQPMAELAKGLATEFVSALQKNTPT